METLTDRALSLALRLLEENHSGRSWRKIAKEDYGNRVNFATLNRVAHSGGEWLPKDRRILEALGLVDPRKPREWLPGEWKTTRIISRMAKETEKEVLKR